MARSGVLSDAVWARLEPLLPSSDGVRGRPVRPCTAGLGGGINGSNSAHSASLISRGGGGDAGEDMLGMLR